MTKHVTQEDKYGLMAISTKESSKMIKGTGTACTRARMDKSMREDSETERVTGKGLSSCLQVKST